ncbi:hypothetical protein LEP1GSC199_2697 [Leptospira vanthielii serovar Holland str. Waz Holland = ATCC 700522]|uniref:Uncharacterized protein n=1 Tax=Leptospira vanthielii serovar Holland str. Waz Holland = ATCC 700522 TaxID=1218591 RepID=N1WAX9_9LEPT|nr:hypothetical protein LEP1GSC199_2697 [Leptospira vanthielii serovar Holland str. Waz Holland = ATCC 700522]
MLLGIRQFIVKDHLEIVSIPFAFQLGYGYFIFLNSLNIT